MSGSKFYNEIKYAKIEREVEDVYCILTTILRKNDRVD